MIKKKSAKTMLLCGCSRSEIKVLPSTWNEPNAKRNLLNEKWRIYYRFYDPLFRDKYPKGKLCTIGGMNEYGTLTERRKVTKDLIDYEKDLLDVKGYNPITGTYMTTPADIVIETEIPDMTPFDEALKWAFNKKKVDRHTKECLKSVLKYFIEATKQLRMNAIPVIQIRRSHILMILEQVGKNKGSKWTANNYNHYRTHLSMLFLELIEHCIIDIDPTDKIKKQKVVKEKRRILTSKECAVIDEHLRKNDFRFWVIMHIFYEAGCRRNELISLRGKDVDMQGQKFKAMVKKGQFYRRVEYTITNAAKYYWEIAMQNCGPDDYVFSQNLMPGKKPILPEYVTKRWKKKVKDELKIDADWYALKHLHTTRVADAHGITTAADFNQESERMIKEHYDVNYSQRAHEYRKSITAPFVETP